jgi:hypothetical protein
MQRVQALRLDVSLQLVPREREIWRQFSINKPLELIRKRPVDTGHSEGAPD